MTFSSLSSIRLDKFTPAELVLAVCSLNNNSADGYDRIPARFIKEMFPMICETLLAYFNDCLDKRIFPEDLKISRIVPIFKDSDKKR
jgi:hypothetical protein